MLSPYVTQKTHTKECIMFFNHHTGLSTSQRLHPTLIEESIENEITMIWHRNCVVIETLCVSAAICSGLSQSM